MTRGATSVVFVWRGSVAYRKEIGQSTQNSALQRAARAVLLESTFLKYLVDFLDFMFATRYPLQRRHDVEYLTCANSVS